MRATLACTGLVVLATFVAGQNAPRALFRGFSGDFCGDDGLLFDGQNDYLAINRDFDLAADHSISMRIKYISMTRNYERLFDFSGSDCGQDSYFVDAYTSTRMTMQTYRCGTLGLDNFWAYGENRFHTYTFTAAANGEYRAYRDGALIGGNRGRCSASATNPTRIEHRIGGSTCVNRGVFTFHGEMEWFAIHNRVLNSNEIQAVSSPPVRASATHFFDMKNDCDPSSDGIPSVLRPITTTTTTTTATTHTIQQAMQNRLNMIEQSLFGNDVNLTNGIESIVSVLRRMEDSVSTNEAALTAATNRISNLEEELSATRSALTQTRADLDTGIAQLSQRVVNTSSVLYNLQQAAQRIPAGRLASDFDRNFATSIDSDGTSVSISSPSCGAVDLCDAVRKLDSIADAMQSVNETTP